MKVVGERPAQSLNGGIMVGGSAVGDAAVYLGDGGLVVNGAADGANGLIQNSVVIKNAAGTLKNFGFMLDGLVTDNVDLLDGGVVINGSATVTDARILFGQTAVDIAGAAGAVTNFATIEGGVYGVVLQDGGRITNGSAGDTRALIHGFIQADASTTVINFGSLVVGVSLLAGGLINNKGLMGTNSLASAVEVAGAVGTLFNSGTINGGAGDGVDLVAGGRVTNGSASDTSAVIRGAIGVYVGTTSALATGTIVNFATIEGEGTTHAAGVLVDGEGRVINGSATDTSATIYGYTSGVVEYAGTVLNFGTIRSGGTTIGHGGVLLVTDGLVTNGSEADTTALISSPEGIVADGSDTVRNFGTVDGSFSGVLALNDSFIVNGSATDTAALIQAATIGVFIETGALANFGTIKGGSEGVGFSIVPGTVRNFATIESATGAGIYLGGGGEVLNNGYRGPGAGALIEGGADGVKAVYHAGTIDNQGSIIGAVGVYLGKGGRITNGAATSGGFIEGAEGVLVKGATGTVDNQGLILAGGASAYAPDRNARRRDGDQRLYKRHRRKISRRIVWGVVQRRGRHGVQFRDHHQPDDWCRSGRRRPGNQRLGRRLERGDIGSKRSLHRPQKRRRVGNRRELCNHQWWRGAA